MRHYTLIHADGSKEHDLTAEDVIGIVNKRYRADMNANELSLLKRGMTLNVVEDGHNTYKIQPN
jgi:hypothetical protein